MSADITPADITAAPLTGEIERLRELMLDWTYGRRSHWNEFAGHADESLSAAKSACAVADAQEVVKLSAAIQALCAIATAEVSS